METFYVKPLAWSRHLILALKEKELLFVFGKLSTSPLWIASVYFFHHPPTKKKTLSETTQPKDPLQCGVSAVFSGT